MVLMCADLYNSARFHCFFKEETQKIMTSKDPLGGQNVRDALLCNVYNLLCRGPKYH